MAGPPFSSLPHSPPSPTGPRVSGPRLLLLVGAGVTFDFVLLWSLVGWEALSAFNWSQPPGQCSHEETLTFGS